MQELNITELEQVDGGFKKALVEGLVGGVIGGAIKWVYDQVSSEN
jgi:lactobin A/cerein 7B family class IIb bacteriocin